MSRAEQQVGVEVPVQEQSARDYEPMVLQIKELLAARLEEFASLNPYVQQN